MNKLLTAGLEVIKGNFDSAVKLYSQPFTPATYRGGLGDSPDWHLWTAGFSKEYKFCYTDRNSALEAYRRCSPLSSIINRKAQTDLNGKRYVMNDKGKEATTDVANDIRRLFKKPNIIQNQASFFAQLKIYMQIYSWVFVYCQPPAGMPRYTARSMWILPNNYLTIKEKDIIPYNAKKLSDFIEYVKFNVNGNQYPIELNDLYIFTDVLPAKKYVLPISRTEILTDPIGNVISAMNSRGTLIRKRGALGIISPRSRDGTGAISVPLQPGQKDELQKEWRSYGTQADQNNIVISNAAIDWTRITMDIGELKLMEEVVDSSKMLCDGYGFPPYLLGLVDPTFNNQLAAEKALYQNTIVPEAENMDDQWNDFFNASEYRLDIQTDFSDLPVMQENKREAATARKTLGEELEREFKLNLITYNRFLELLGEDTTAEATGLMYYYQLQQAGFYPAPPVAQPPIAAATPPAEQPKNIIHIYNKYDSSEPRDNSGRWTDSSGSSDSWMNGEEDAARMKALGIPPAWTGVKLNANTEADLLATGFDSKGRKQYIYSQNATMRQAEAKFTRNQELVKKQNLIANQNAVNITSKDFQTAENASAMSVILDTGIRPGSSRETFGAVKAYGATTLEGRHIIEDGFGGVRLQFVGKKGVNIDVPVNDKQVAGMLLQRKAKVGNEGKIFQTDDAALRAYSKTLDGGAFKPKDFRTLKGTTTAIKYLKGVAPAKNLTEYKRIVSNTAKEVSKVLGNTPSIALKSYINPFVFLKIKPTG